MGASQSMMPEPLVQEKLAERLQNLEVKESSQSSEKDYVYVDEEKEAPSGEYSPTVSISATEQWEKKLLEDPKVPDH